MNAQVHIPSPQTPLSQSRLDTTERAGEEKKWKKVQKEGQRQSHDTCIWMVTKIWTDGESNPGPLPDFVRLRHYAKGVLYH